MQLRTRASRSAQLIWLWALLPLLLAAGLIIPKMADDAFQFGEVASLRVAGALDSGPWSLANVWSSVAEISSEQALGWPMLLSVWGHSVNWSEFTVRAMPFFAGMLTIAWVYRTGHDLFATSAGVIAALLLSASVFFLAYMIHARAFTLVTLFATLCIWSYWRLALHPQPPGKGAQAGLLLGSVGLLYSHYFGALLLPALGLFHLLFVPRNRHWWRPVPLVGFAALLASPQLPVFLRGLDRTINDDALHSQSLTSPEWLVRLLHRMTNGAVNTPASVSELLVILLPLALMVAVLLRLHKKQSSGAMWLLVFTSATLLVLMLSANEVIKVAEEGRVRYLIALWPLTALLVSVSLLKLTGIHRLLVAGMIVCWLFAGVWLTLATDFRYELDVFRPTEFHLVSQVMHERIAATDLLIMDTFAAQLDSDRFYVRRLGLPWEIVRRYREDPYEKVRPVHADYPYLWLLYLSKDRVGFADLPHELGRVFCERVLDEWGFTLERFALSSVENCPDRPVRLEFDSGIRLTTPEITLLDGLLRLDAHFRSADDYLLSRYSLASHVFDQSGVRVAQGDTGVGPGTIVPLRSEIDISALPRGEYELRVALYDWQTGARLPARDLKTGETSDMHTLQRFRIG